jgi:hypothetical protein
MSTLPLLRTLQVYYVGVAELKMIGQCPTLQHLSITTIENTGNDDFGPAIGQMTQLKSLSIEMGNLGIPDWMDSSSSQSWLHLKSLIHLQRLTIKGCEIKSLESLPQLIELVSCLSNIDPLTSHNSLETMKDIPCDEWLSINGC